MSSGFEAGFDPLGTCNTSTSTSNTTTTAATTDDLEFEWLDPVTTTMSEVGISPANTQYRRPTTRQRIQKPPPSLDVPDINQDASERKRVLNVLAQRRYRERKRQAKKTSSSKSKEHPEQISHGQPSLSLSAASAHGSIGPIAPVMNNGISDSISEEILASMDTDIAELEMTARDAWSTPGNISDTTAFTEMLMNATDPAQLANYDEISSSELQSLSADDIFNSSGSSSSSSPPSSFFYIDPNALTTTANANANHNHNHNHNNTNRNTNGNTTCHFPDSYYLPVNELKLLTASLRIATRLHCSETIFSPIAPSPFTPGGALHPSSPSSSLPLSLPHNFRPTPSQTTVPHHPVFDLLPWPSVRDRIIMLLALPDALRPPQVRNDSSDPGDTSNAMVVARFAYDLEDAAEGVRIHGEDVYDERNWEVGQTVFENWWFVFDRGVVGRSNELRKGRGAGELRLKGAA